MGLVGTHGHNKVISLQTERGCKPLTILSMSRLYFEATERVWGQWKRRGDHTQGHLPRSDIRKEEARSGI